MSEAHRWKLLVARLLLCWLFHLPPIVHGFLTHRHPLIPSTTCPQPTTFENAESTLFGSHDRSSDGDYFNTEVDEAANIVADRPKDEERSQEFRDDRETDVQNFARNPEWLDAATKEILDLEQYPIGSLTGEDVEYVTSLMIAWSRRWLHEAPTNVEALLKRVVDDLKAGNHQIAVSTTMYTSAIDAWGKSGAKGRAERAQSIHDAMLQKYKATNDPSLAPSVLSFNTLLNVWAKSGEPDVPKRVEAVLEQLLNSRTGAEFLVPDAVTISTILDAYARSSDKGTNVTRCEEIFESAEKWNITKTLYTYSTLQNVYARSGRSNGARKALEILDSMWKRFEDGDVLAKPNSVNYNAVLNAASRSPTAENTAMGIELLRRMELPSHQGGDDVDPDRLSYALTILCCSRCNDPVLGVETAEKILERMEARARQEEKRRKVLSSAAPPSVRLDVECFNVVLTALARDSHRGIDRMRTIVDRMERYAANGVSSVRPNVRTWNAILNAMARSSRGRMDYADEAEDVLRKMFHLHQTGVQNTLPNGFSFAAVLTTFQRCSNLTSVTERADQIVRQMEELYQKGLIEDHPDVYHYTILCGVWAKSRIPGAADRCVQILSHMMERHNSGFPNILPNVRTFNAVLDCFARNKQAERAEQLLYHMLALSRNNDKGAAPDAFSFNSVIHAFTQSTLKDSGRRAEAVLDRFLEYNELEDPTVKPDARSFTKIISYYGKARKTWAGIKNSDSPYRAEYILNRMLALYKEGHSQLAPPSYAFTTVIDSYSYAKHPDAGRNAERLLRLARGLSSQAHLQIDRTFINSVLFAWANCGDSNAGIHASAHLAEMELAYKRGNVAMRPDSKTYSLVLSAWSTSVAPEKAKNALSIIEAMKQQINEGNPDVVLDEHHFALAINACAFSNSGVEAENEAFRIAARLFDEVVVSDLLQATSLTYGWFLQCCGRLRVPEIVRDAHIERAFRLCCADGLVTDFVVKRLIGAASEDLYDSLMEPSLCATRKLKGRISRSLLPPEWTRRTGGSKWRD